MSQNPKLSASLAELIRDRWRGSIPELAMACRVWPATIYRWRSAQQTAIRPTTVRRLAVALDVAPQTVLGACGYLPAAESAGAGDAAA